MTTSTAHDNDQWQDALDGIGLTEDGQADHPTLSLLFANALYPDFDALAAEAFKRSGASVLVGCTGRGVIGGGTEIEGRPALAILNLDLPGAQLFSKHIETSDIAGLIAPAGWYQLLGAKPDQVNAWLVLADPFTFDVEPLIAGLAAAYSGKPITGGLASGLAYASFTWLMLNEQPYSSGAIVLGVGGNVTLRSVVAQGAAPLGQPQLVTASDGPKVQTINNRPAADVRREVIDALAEDLRWQAQESLLVGLSAADGTGEVLIRDVLSSDRRTGVVEIRGTAPVGQPLQFYLADPQHADRELRAQLSSTKTELAGAQILGALLCSAVTRGIELFQVHNHDSDAINETLGDLSLAGFFSTGEIATTPSRGPQLHGSTATLTFFVKT